MVSEQSQAHRTHKYVNNAWSESSNSPPTLLFIPLSRRQDMLLLWQTRPHIARFCFKAKNNKEKEIANKAMDDDDYAFATKDGDHCKAICKWIMDLGATKHMTPH
jgi:hypothetical protein